MNVARHWIGAPGRDVDVIARYGKNLRPSAEGDPEMSQSKKGNQWYFGMKAHIGVDAESGLVHTAGVTTGQGS